jgi:hypothetical protein
MNLVEENCRFSSEIPNLNVFRISRDENQLVRHPNSDEPPVISDVSTDDLDEFCHIQITSTYLLQVSPLTLRRLVNQLESIAKQRNSRSSLQEQLHFLLLTSPSFAPYRNLPTQLKLSGVLRIDKNKKNRDESGENWQKHFSVLSQRELKSF